MKPGQILLFLSAVLLLLGMVGMVAPEGGLQVAGQVIRIPDPRTVFFPTPKDTVDISNILALTTDDESDDEGLPADSIPLTLDLPEDVVKALDLDALPPLMPYQTLQFPEGHPDALDRFFEELEGARTRKRPIRVMHYGDSQLEGDRITAYLRHKLQTHFGGRGPGLVAVADIVPHFSVDRTLSDNWKRYSAMDRKDSTFSHTRFGVLSAFSRFTPILPDSVLPDTSRMAQATVALRPNGRTYRRAREWTVCRLLFGHHRAPVKITVAADGAAIAEETVPARSRLLDRTWYLPSTPQELTITFRGADSPDVYGISLEGPRGVCVDNIAARGAAGYELNRSDGDLLASSYADLDVELIILQYGGNVLPNIATATEAERYGAFIGQLIGRMRRLAPGAAILVIGPSDMSIKDGDRYVTRPLLEEVRDAMRMHTLRQGAVFWDMYTAMGGRGSMVEWVLADPPLAAPDYTHFSPLGSRKIGELFHSALIHAYAERRRMLSPKGADPAPAAQDVQTDAPTP